MHCINLILIKKSELRNSKISTIMDIGNFTIDSPFLELPQNILAFPTLSKNSIYKFFGPDITFVQVSTDYYGGMGDQSASILKTMSIKKNSDYYKEKSYYEIKSDFSLSAIDNILKEYGIIRKDNLDEFDTINLGKYRKNEDIIDEINKINLISEIIKNTKSF